MCGNYLIFFIYLTDEGGRTQKHFSQSGKQTLKKSAGFVGDTYEKKYAGFASENS